MSDEIKGAYAALRTNDDESMTTRPDKNTPTTRESLTGKLIAIAVDAVAMAGSCDNAGTKLEHLRVCKAALEALDLV